MNRNVEIKARVASRRAGIERRARDLADEGPVTLVQEDTFFVCPRGRLKLRRLGAAEGELIYYERPDSAEPKESRYAVCRTPDPEGLAALPLTIDDGLLEAEDRWFESSIINNQSSIINGRRISGDQLVHEAYIDLLEAL